MQILVYWRANGQALAAFFAPPAIAEVHFVVNEIALVSLSDAFTDGSAET
jgi:hypothetical protein